MEFKFKRFIRRKELLRLGIHTPIQTLYIYV